MLLVTLTPGDVGTVITTSHVYINSIRVIGTAATAAGHAYRIVHPGTGQVRWRSVASGAWYVEESITQRVWYYGYKLEALDSGVMDIEINEFVTNF
jgi:hypothetical protein